MFGIVFPLFVRRRKKKKTGLALIRTFALAGIASASTGFLPLDNNRTSQQIITMSSIQPCSTLARRALSRNSALKCQCQAQRQQHQCLGAARSFSVLNRPPPKYTGHVPLTTIERGALAIGSAFGSLVDPRRGGKSHTPPSVYMSYSM